MIRLSDLDDSFRDDVLECFRPIHFTNGCFDLFHAGHAKALLEIGDIVKNARQGSLIVGINSDESVRRLKGNDRPIYDEESRQQIVDSIRGVAFSIVFDEDTPENLIRWLRPDFLYKSEDYLGKDIIAPGVPTVKMTKFDPKHSTTKTIEKIRAGKP